MWFVWINSFPQWNWWTLCLLQMEKLESSEKYSKKSKWTGKWSFCAQMTELPSVNGKIQRRFWQLATVIVTKWQKTESKNGQKVVVDCPQMYRRGRLDKSSSWLLRMLRHGGSILQNAFNKCSEILHYLQWTKTQKGTIFGSLNVTSGKYYWNRKSVAKVQSRPTSRGPSKHRRAMVYIEDIMPIVEGKNETVHQLWP